MRLFWDESGRLEKLRTSGESGEISAGGAVGVSHGFDLLTD